MRTKVSAQTSISVLTFLVLLLFGARTSTAAPGDLDQTFGAGGSAITVLPDQNIARKMAIQPDGKIVVSGYGSANTGFSSFLVRYNPNGTLDTSFGTNGTVIIPYQKSPNRFERAQMTASLSRRD